MPFLKFVILLVLFRVQSTCPFTLSLSSGRVRYHSEDATKLSSIARETDTFACSVIKRLTREEACKLMDETILPLSKYDHRQRSGRDAQGLTEAQVVNPTDAIMEFTYGEFPFNSLDELLDRASPYLSSKKNIQMIDIGSGCGRLVFYTALTRGSEDNSWTIHGVEIADLLHDEALRATLNGLDSGWFRSTPGATGNHFILHKGPAGEFSSILGQCDVVFAYSTVWNSIGFSEELGAMVISQEWNELISKSCKKGTVIITTDRAMDPGFGFKLVDRLDVENREVMGSTGYIHVLR